MRVLVEAVGSPAWPTLLPFLRAIAPEIVALEVDPWAAGAQLVEWPRLVPPYAELASPEPLLRICEEERVDLVLPSVNEGLPLWAKHRDAFAARGAHVLISPESTIGIFHDKWETYRFFRDRGVPTPETSLEHRYEIVKPRVGRGGAGVRRIRPGTLADLAGCVSQRRCTGPEISIDVLCDLAGRPVYKVQRERTRVASGLAVQSRVIFDPEIDRGVDRILAGTRVVGIANVQGFREPGGVLFTEVNPRIPGGLSLSMAATENWFPLLLKVLREEPIEPVTVRRGLVMLRHYSDVFVHEADIERRYASGGQRDRCSDDAGSTSSPESAPSTTSCSR